MLPRYHRIHVVDVRLAPAVLCALLTTLACGGSTGSSDGAMIDWDLSAGHSIEHVEWPKPDVSAVEISPVDSVHLKLPGGKRFPASGELVHDVTLDRSGRLLRGLQIDSHPRSRARAYELAARWADEWGVSREPFDEWREGAKSTP
jgi:hypothetical protein